jgi:hypothetical protein
MLLLYSIRLPMPPPVASCGLTRDHRIKLGALHVGLQPEQHGRHVEAGHAISKK